MTGGYAIATDPEIIRLYHSISTILRNKDKGAVKNGNSSLTKPYFSVAERGGLFTFDTLRVSVPFLTNVISSADTWTNANSSIRFLSDRVEATLKDVSNPILDRCRSKWGVAIRDIDVGYRMSAPFQVKVNNIDYVFRSDAVMAGIDYSQGNQNRLVYIFLQEANFAHPRRGLCQVQRVTGKESILEAAFCVYPGYSQTKVFSLRDKNYFTGIESSLV